MLHPADGLARPVSLSSVSERTARLDELLREEISDVIRREVDDPRIGFVTVTNVEVASDLRHAIVWVSVIGTADQRKRGTARALARDALRARASRPLRLKRIPELHVKEDQTAERATRVLRILESLEDGGAGDVPELEETLPTPTGISALEPVDETAVTKQQRQRRPRSHR